MKDLGNTIYAFGCASMSDCNEDLNQTDQEIILRYEVSDQALEAASVARGGLSTLLYGTYCFACPSRPTIRSQIADTDEARRIAANIAKLPELLLK